MTFPIEDDGTASSAQECPTVKQKLEKAWRLALAIAPLAAIALVEAAMKRW